MVLLIIAAVSGTGKSTVAQSFFSQLDGEIQLSVSHTTRAMRPGEAQGVHYHFVDRPAFEQQIAEGRFVEWAQYAGNLYGTSEDTIEAARAAGIDLLFDVEIQGVEALKRAYPEAISVFFLPPNWAELRRRLSSRGTETAQTIERRLARGLVELEAAETFDHLVINGALDEAVAQLRAIYQAAREGRGARGADDALRAHVRRLREEAAQMARG